MSDIDAAPVAPSALPEATPLTFGQGFSYPFNRAIGLLNILWILIPIVGWLAIGGYAIRIVREFSMGMTRELPKLSFWSDCGHALAMFFKALPFFIVYGLVIGLGGWLLDQVGTPGWALFIINLAINILVLPILTINFFRHATVASYFDLGVLSPVFEHIGDYLWAVIKDIALSIVFLVLCIVLVGLPALSFTKYIFLADFYRRRVG